MVLDENELLSDGLSLPSASKDAVFCRFTRAPFREKKDFTSLGMPPLIIPLQWTSPFSERKMKVRSRRDSCSGPGASSS